MSSGRFSRTKNRKHAENRLFGGFEAKAKLGGKTSEAEDHTANEAASQSEATELGKERLRSRKAKEAEAPKQETEELRVSFESKQSKKRLYLMSIA